MANSLKAPGTTTQTSSGSAHWHNTDNIKANDGNYADVPLGTETSEGLIAYNFGFAIPSGSTINGWIVTVEHKASASGSVSMAVYVGVWNGSSFASLVGLQGYNHANMGSSDHACVLGSSTDIWEANEAPSVTTVNDSSFAVQVFMDNTSGLVRTAYVDYITLDMYYTAASGPAGLNTVNGLAKASVKVINGLAIASVKTWDGLA